MRTRTFSVTLGVLAMAILTLAGLAISINTGQAASHLTFTVNSTGDAGDLNTGDSACATGAMVGDDPECTLRAAIEQANAHTAGGKDEIHFGIAGCPDGVCTIIVDSVLDVTDPLVIDGYKQPGATEATEDDPADLRIELSGRCTAENISPPVLPCWIPSAEFEGLLVLNEGSGGDEFDRGSLIQGLVITGSGDYGVNIKSSYNTIRGSYFGTDVSGNAAKPNFHGVYIDGADHNLIGGTEPAARNVISGNQVLGLVLAEEEEEDGFEFSEYNIIQGNYIGVGADGSTPLGNAVIQIYNYEDSKSTLIGGTVGLSSDVCTGACNVIDGGLTGVFTPDSTDATVTGNYIGVKQDGRAGAGGVNYGVYLAFATGVLVEDNVIGRYDVGVFSPMLSTNETIKNNRIGIGPGADCLGSSSPSSCDIGNGTGIRIASRRDGHTIEGNIIANNDRGGVEIGGEVGFWCVLSPRVAARITANSIFNNGGLGIDIAERPCPTYGNVTLPFPTVVAGIVTAHSITVAGGFSGTPNTNFDLEFFASSVCNPDEHGNPDPADDYGEGERFLGSINVTTNGLGDVIFAPVFPETVPAVGDVVTATATNTATGATSEFSRCVVTTQTDDNDLDGCTAAQEEGMDETRGGQRNDSNFWDFFDTETDNGLAAGSSKAGEITTGDRDKVIAHLYQIGDPDVNGDGNVDAADALTDATGSGYHPRFDVGARTIEGHAWSRGAADGLINIVDDLVAIVGQVGHSCGP